MGELDGIRWILHVDALHRYELPLGLRQIVGRAADATLRLPDDDPTSARFHASFEATTLGVHVVALEGDVVVNEAKTAFAQLKDGDVIRLGKTRFRIVRRVEPAPRPDPRIAASAVQAPWTSPATCDACGGELDVPHDESPEVARICDRCADERRTDPSGWEVAAPRTIDRFELLRFLARGGMSAVYEARDPRSKLRVALKILIPDRTLEGTAKKRFVKEQRIASALVHPRIARCYAVGTAEGGQLWVATEFLARGDMDALADRRSNIRAVLGAAADLFEALAFAHDLGVVHRDVKPSNLLLATPDADGRARAKLSDFGLAKHFREIGGTVVTTESDVGGSAMFVAPEQLLGFRDVGPSADLYAGATSVYYLLTGELPLPLPCRAEDALDTQLCLATLGDERVPLARRRPEVHPILAQWIDLLVQRDHEKRSHVGAAQVAQTLRAYPG